MSILYVSHHLDEVFELADRVTVLRDGVRKATRAVSELDHGGLVELIVGHRIDAVVSSDVHDRQHTGALGARPQGPHRPSLDLDVMPGEIVGLAGHHRFGPRARARADRRADPSRRRRRHARRQAGRQLPPRKAIASGVAFVPAERALRGTIAPMNVRENLTITDVRRFVEAMR